MIRSRIYGLDQSLEPCKCSRMLRPFLRSSCIEITRSNISGSGSPGGEGGSSNSGSSSSSSGEADPSDDAPGPGEPVGCCSPDTGEPMGDPTTGGEPVAVARAPSASLLGGASVVAVEPALASAA